MVTPDRPGSERRRDQRIEVQINLKVKWKAQDGTSKEAPAITQSINGYGGCFLFVKAALMEGMAVELENPSAGKTCPASVVWCGEVDSEGRTHAGIELDQPDEEFWGPKFKEAKREGSFWVD